MSAFVKAQICTQLSLHADSVTMVQHPWQRLFQDPSMSWENRTIKDISTVDSKLDCLQANDKSLHANTAVGRACYDTGILSSTDQPSTERLWQGYCKYPTLQSDGESNEVSGKVMGILEIMLSHLSSVIDLTVWTIKLSARDRFVRFLV